MNGVLRSWRFAAACLVAAGLVCLAAVLDHRDKQRRIDAAQVDEYYCLHMGTRCGGASWHTIEHHWQIRQYSYEVAAGVLGALAVTVFVLSRRKPAVTTSSSRWAR